MRWSLIVAASEEPLPQWTISETVVAAGLGSW